MRNRALALAALLLFLTPLLLAAPAGKVEPIGPLTDSAASEALKKAVEATGYRVLLDDGSEWCKIWLRAGAPASGKTEEEGALFPQLTESTLIGVISFTKPATDYRGQAVQPGLYTLRYELLPNDGNHLGVADNRDFALLVRAGDDPDPAANFDFKQLVALSRKATGAAHPGPINLVQPASDTVPAVSNDGQEHWIFADKVKMQPGEPLLIGIVVKGKAAE
ncbi:MAG TPA: hypothetical protein VJP04_13345 [Terriglobales bacterium]|nr:hypothetical protein [Terriglobales bacterium]